MAGRVRTARCAICIVVMSTANASLALSARASDWTVRIHRYSPVFMLLICFVVAPFVHADFIQRLAYPPGLDQDAYLVAGRNVVNHFVFMPGKPLYSAWMGLMYVLSGSDLKACFYLEKTVSVLLFAFLMAMLGLTLFGARTATLMGLWALSCKYLTLEPNGSHAFAASLSVASVLCFFLPSKAARLPASLLLAFATTLVRPEMKLPFYCIGLGLLAWHFVNRRKRDSQAAERSGLSDQRATYWAAAAAVAIALTALFALRSTTDRSYFHRLAFQEFAATYMDRNHLPERFPTRFPGRWDATAQSAVYHEIIPMAATPVEIVRFYPHEVLGNILYNIKTSVTRVLPAMFLAFDRRVLMLLALVLYCASFAFWREHRNPPPSSREGAETIRTVLIVWALASALVLPVVMLLHVSARQFIQEVPVLILLGTIALRRLVSTRFPLAWQPR